MTLSSSILKDGHRYNSSHRSTQPQPLKVDCDPSSTCTTPQSFAYYLMAQNPTETAPCLPSSLSSKTYFASPIRTLSESLSYPGQCCISTHDLVEAYNVLSTRIRSLMTHVPSTNEPLPCMLAFQENASEITQCISRDLQRLLPSPFDSEPPQYSFSASSFVLDSSSDVDEIQTMTDNILLCQYALRFASDIFVFPMLYSNFSDNLLVSLLRDVLSLCTVTHQPIPNIDKTCDTVLWILKVQQLPISILLSTKVAIVTVLQSSLSDKRRRSSTRVNALKAIHCISTRHPTFVNSFIGILPAVLDNLNAKSLELRLTAALALCGFATAKLKSENDGSYPRSEATEKARNYLDRQSARRRQDSLQRDPLLPDILQSALSGDEFWQEYGPSFALAVVSSFLVLLDRFLWTSSRPLRLLVKTIAQVAGQKRSNIRHAHPELWRILIWAFGRLQIQPDADDDQSDVESLRSTRESAYQIVLQERRSRLSLDLIDALLCPHDGERSSADVRKVVDVTLDLLKSDNPASKGDGIQVLGRLMASIGAPTSVQHSRVSTISFPLTLVDGSLLSQKSNELRVSRVEFDFERLAPLSEDEVLAQWDDLAQGWIRAAQHCLDIDQNISSLLGVWQALLLVRGDLIESHHHFTAPSPFAKTVSDILTAFSTPLHTPDQQLRYITFLSKLWGVLRNVFSREWLSSPAETVLERFLEKPFDLSSASVKGVWCQMCRDLISVGIPALLHILHVRAENKAGMDVTRELWFVAAGRDASIADGADWMDLLRLLAVPIGAWEMGPVEFEVWEQVLSKAFEVGIGAHQSRRVLISRFFEGLPDSKLDSLKTKPRILCKLLSHSLPVPLAEIEPKLLSFVDECLQMSYHDTGMEDGNHDSALQLIRMVGEVLSKLNASEIVAFLSTMQKSLCCWITDEREVLTSALHDEVVALLYKRSLELLSEVEPSIAVLTDLADFIQSVFLRIRGDGVFAFQTFWRSTYHIRKDIPKDLYPLQIKACLQAWSDFCDDSFADDIPSDSGSQSLDTSIPDSQLAESMSFGLQSYPEDYQAIFDPAVNAAEASHGATTPTRRSHALPSLDVPFISVPVKEDNTPQNYGGRYSRSQSMERDNLFLHSGNNANHASTSKRPAEFETPSNSKRRRLDISRLNFKPRAGKERAHEPSLSYKSNVSILLSSASEPVTRNSSPIPPPSASQPSQSRKGFDRGSRASWLATRRNTTIRDADTHAILPRAIGSSPVAMRSSDDYDTWERVVSTADLKAVREGQEDDSEFFVPDSQDDPDLGSENDDTEPASDQDDSDEDILSPSLGKYPARSRPRYRSQTAPELDDSHSHSLSRAQPLRRHQTSPGPLTTKTLSTQLDALRNAYAALTDTVGISQVDVQEILQARRLANQINQVLDEQICSKLTSSRPRTPEA